MPTTKKTNAKKTKPSTSRSRPKATAKKPEPKAKKQATASKKGGNNAVGTPAATVAAPDLVTVREFSNRCLVLVSSKAAISQQDGAVTGPNGLSVPAIDIRAPSDSAIQWLLTVEAAGKAAFVGARVLLGACVAADLDAQPEDGARTAAIGRWSERLGRSAATVRDLARVAREVAARPTELSRLLELAEAGWASFSRSLAVPLDDEQRAKRLSDEVAARYADPATARAKVASRLSKDIASNPGIVDVAVIATVAGLADAITSIEDPAERLRVAQAARVATTALDKIIVAEGGTKALLGLPDEKS